ncbi:hypothetical protein [Bifidobacterium scardovii]|uniref:hypothetical protein n=1 Tax=Bifidobacterium scardovii TaxID=158787 RepID=UPI000529EB8D|nr:hypothetical protein [Bifidobacterium scardovii]MDK6349504.1 hypothetical protein [Bifidobacterium scardovii]MDU8982627.1 hypothetical protein [Bifidobacterium scardovii]
MSAVHHPKTIDDYRRERGISDEGLAETNRITQRYIDDYDRRHHPLRYLRRKMLQRADRRHRPAQPQRDYNEAASMS